MKLQVLQENLAQALNITSRFASSRAQLPVLANVLFNTKKNKLLVSATNLEISVCISVGAKVQKQGEITIPARTITDLVSNLQSGSLNIESEKEILSITSSNFSSKLSGMNSSDFPEVPKEIGKSELNLPSDSIISALSQVLFAASIDETRPVLTGVLFIIETNKLILVATDGFRLSQKKLSIKNSKKATGSQKMILPKNALAELLRLIDTDENIKFSFKKNENQVVFGIDQAVLASRIIDGEFPDFERIIPKDTNVTIEVDREELLRGVKLASVFARDAANVVKVTLGKSSLSLSAESSLAGSQKSRIDAKIDGKVGKEFEIAFNYRFLEDFLQSAKGEAVQIEFSSPNAPGVFTDPGDKDYLHLIMPVRT